MYSSSKIYILCVLYFVVSGSAEISNDIEFPNRYVNFLHRSLFIFIEFLLQSVNLWCRHNLPKPVNYFTLASNEDSSTQNSEKHPGARFTYPTGATLEGYGSNYLSHGFYPLKFDLGGLVLGVIFGLGALLFIPKLIHLLVPELAAYGHYAGAPFGRSKIFQNWFKVFLKV